jgi:hypothetical protein
MDSDARSTDAALPKPTPPTATAATVVAKREELHLNAASAPTPPPPPAAILPDDVANKVRPEDYLPYFQFPGVDSPSNDVNAPGQAPASQSAPKTLPPSSASYQETLQ